MARTLQKRVTRKTKPDEDLSKDLAYLRKKIFAGLGNEVKDMELNQETKDAIEEVIEGIVRVGQQTGQHGLTKMLCYYVFGLLQNPHEKWFSSQKGEEDRGKDE